MLEGGIVSYLSAQSTLTALIGSPARIFPVVAPEDITLYPCLVYRLVSYVPEYGFQGQVGLSLKRIVFEAKSTVYGDVRNICAALAPLLSGYRGNLPDGTNVQETEIFSGSDQFSDAARTFTSSIHARFLFNE